MMETIQNQIVSGQQERNSAPTSANQNDSDNFSNSLMAVINNIATNKEIDISKLSAMLDMQERILNRNAKQAFTADLAAMQAELPLVGKHGEGHNKAKYALLEDINEAIRPTLQKYGFAVTFRVKQQPGMATITAILSHKVGHSEETDLILPLDTSGSKNAVQAVGSTLSYGKRYALCALLNISTGDDMDGNLPPAATVEKLTVSEEDMKSIRAALLVAGYLEADFCKAAGIKQLSDMLLSRMAGALEHIKGKANASD